MQVGFVNDIGYGKCPSCKEWKSLTSYYHLDLKKPRNERRKCCGKCNARHQAIADPLFYVKKAIALHKTVCKEGDYTLLDINKLHQWQGFTCCYCNEPIHYGFTIDHIVPQVKGGKNLKFNILLACLTCNSSKQDFELNYWLKRKNLLIKPKIMEKITGAYNGHDYTFKRECILCKFNASCCHPTCGKYKRNL